jgi:hypothetical protein
MSNIYIVSLNDKTFYFTDIIHASCFVLFKIIKDDNIKKNYEEFLLLEPDELFILYGIKVEKKLRTELDIYNFLKKKIIKNYNMYLDIFSKTASDKQTKWLELLSSNPKKANESIFNYSEYITNRETESINLILKEIFTFVESEVNYNVNSMLIPNYKEYELSKKLIFN